MEAEREGEKKFVHQKKESSMYQQRRFILRLGSFLQKAKAKLKLDAVNFFRV